MDLMLVVMPFANPNTPSLAAGLLQAAVRLRGFRCTTRYANLEFAELIGDTPYASAVTAFGTSALTGDWMFAEALFGEKTPPAERYLRCVMEANRVYLDPAAELRLYNGKPFLRYLEEDVWPDLLTARERCVPFVEESSRGILQDAPRVVGFTVSSQQVCASLAVARRLKESEHPPLVIFGGPACFGDMGLQMLRLFPWIDYVCTGEGDEVFPLFLERLLREGDGSPLPGILKQGASVSVTLPPPVRDLDRLPLPDFDDYFAHLAATARGFPGCDYLPCETTRGCWWGERNRCGFCGDPPFMQGFRSKSPPRAASEMERLTQRYRPPALSLSDNMLDFRHLETLYPALAASGGGARWYCQMKTNLSRDQLATLGSSGAEVVWFGIETLSNRLLKLLPKGNSAQQGVQMLRWSQELGIRPGWNLLYGICGETPEDYDGMAEIVPLLAHLQPPSRCFLLELLRFSRYLEEAEEHGLRRLRPASSYGHIFPLAPEEVERLAFFFEADRAGGDPELCARPVRHAAALWQALWEQPPERRPRLDLYRGDGSSLLAVDTRPCAVSPSHRLHGLAAEVYLSCDRVRSLPRLAAELRHDAGEVRAALRELVEARLLWQDGERYLALACFRNRGR